MPATSSQRGSTVQAALARLQQVVEAQERYFASAAQGLTAISSEVLHALQFERGRALEGVAGSIRGEETSLRTRLGLYRDIQGAAAAVATSEQRLLGLYTEESRVLEQAMGVYQGVGRPDLASRLGARREELALRSAGVMRQAEERRGEEQTTELRTRLRTLEAFVRYGEEAGVPPETLAAARGEQSSLLQTQAARQRAQGDLAAYWRTQQELLRLEKQPSLKTPGVPPPSPTLASYAEAQHAVLQSILGGHGLRGPLFSPLGLQKAGESEDRSTYRVAGVRQEKATIVVELRPPGRSQEVFLDQWAQLIAGKLAHWIRTAV